MIFVVCARCGVILTPEEIKKKLETCILGGGPPRCHQTIIVIREEES